MSTGTRLVFRAAIQAAASELLPLLARADRVLGLCASELLPLIHLRSHLAYFGRKLQAQLKTALFRLVQSLPMKA